MDGIVSHEEGQHSNDASKAGTLPVRDDANRYSSSVHAHVPGGSLKVS